MDDASGDPKDQVAGDIFDSVDHYIDIVTKMHDRLVPVFGVAAHELIGAYVLAKARQMDVARAIKVLEDYLKGGR